MNNNFYFNPAKLIMRTLQIRMWYLDNDDFKHNVDNL